MGIKNVTESHISIRLRQLADSSQASLLEEMRKSSKTLIIETLRVIPAKAGIGNSYNMVDRSYYVYILGNERPTLYIGVTNNLVKRIYEHKGGFVEGFTKRYNLKRLLYYEVFNDIKHAISREKNMKAWKRQWKINLIQKSNPGMEDLYGTLI